MTKIDGKPLMTGDIGRKVYVVCNGFHLFGVLSRFTEKMVWVKCFDDREHICNPSDVHWGARADQHYRVHGGG